MGIHTWVLPPISKRTRIRRMLRSIKHIFQSDTSLFSFLSIDRIPLHRSAIDNTSKTSECNLLFPLLKKRYPQSFLLYQSPDAKMPKHITHSALYNKSVEVSRQILSHNPKNKSVPFLTFLLSFRDNTEGDAK